LSDLPASAARVQAALDRFGLGFEVRRFAESTRTSQEAAEAVGCDLAQIAKSLLFRGRDSGRPIMVIASGANRVDEKKLAALAGEKVRRADADFVRAATGYAIGGVPPVAHAQPVAVYIDRDLLALDEIWAAAGTPNSVFRLTPAALAQITGGQVGDLRQDPA